MFNTKNEDLIRSLEDDLLESEALCNRLVDVNGRLQDRITELEAPPAPLMQGRWEIHTLDDPPLIVEAQWRELPPFDDQFDRVLNRAPVWWADVELMIFVGHADTVTIPLARVTYIDEKIITVPEPTPPPSRVLAFDYEEE